MKEKIYKYCKNFSKNLKIERKSRNLTQKQVAEAIGIKTQSYQAYENNVALPSAENLLKIVTFFEISLDDLFEIK
ncbi:MAG: helix-turn-helix transcriptional regulator [Clostridia bacterium]|nr:helix-turn-helix transcriptional regulator [Clostridia bacterium]